MTSPVLIRAALSANARSTLLLWVLAIAGSFAAATMPAAGEVPAQLSDSLQRMRVPLSSVSLYAQRISDETPAWSVHADIPRNPASVMKLVTTLAALQSLGPPLRLA